MDLSDEGRHEDFVFHWEKVGNTRKKCLIALISVPQLHKKKVFNCFDFSTTVTHGAYKIFEIMT